MSIIAIFILILYFLGSCLIIDSVHVMVSKKYKKVEGKIIGKREKIAQEYSYDYQIKGKKTYYNTIYSYISEDGSKQIYQSWINRIIYNKVKNGKIVLLYISRDRILTVYELGLLSVYGVALVLISELLLFTL